MIRDNLHHGADRLHPRPIRIANYELPVYHFAQETPLANPASAGGWTISGQDFYDPERKLLRFGAGGESAARNVDTFVQTIGQVNTTTGNSPVLLTTADGGYLLSNGNQVLKYSDTTGRFVFAGTGTAGYSGDGGPATAATFNNITGLAQAPDGSLYVVDSGNHRIRKIAPDGRVSTYAGTGAAAASACTVVPVSTTNPAAGVLRASTPYTATSLNLNPQGLAVDQEGVLYVGNGTCVLRITPDGLAYAWVGGGQKDPAVASNLPGPGSSFAFNAIRNLVLGNNGELYLFVAPATGNTGHYIFRWTPDGILYPFAGDGNSPISFPQANGFTASSASLSLSGNAQAAFSLDSNLVFAESRGGKSVIRIITPKGVVNTYAGTAATGSPTADGAAQQVAINPTGLAYGPDRSLYFYDSNNQSIRRISSSASPDISVAGNEILLADSGGSLLRVFGTDGRHLRTVDANTGAVLTRLGYDSNNRLISLTDLYGRVTTLTRNASGDLTSITAPGGQITNVSMTSNQLTSLTTPAGLTWRITYGSGGLMNTFTDPRGGVRQYTWDDKGRLIREQDPVGGGLSLISSDVALNDANIGIVSQGTQIQARTTATSNSFYSEIFQNNANVDGSQSLEHTDQSGLLTRTLTRGDRTIVTTNPDGSVETTFPGTADPRFGMMSPVTSSQITTPSGLTQRISQSRTAVGAESNPLGFTSLGANLTINSRTFASTYIAATRTQTSTSPGGRVSSTVVDAKGQPITISAPGVADVTLTYDSLGQVTRIAQDARTQTFTWNSAGLLTGSTDAAGNKTSYSYDADGRLTQTTLPNQSTIAYQYDGNDNLTKLTLPSGAIHTYSYTGVDLTSAYTPPVLTDVPNPATNYQYNLAKQLTSVTRPDGQVMSLSYDAGGRLTTLTQPTGVIRYSFDQGVTCTTGQVNCTARAASGQLTSITSPEATLAYTWDGPLPTSEAWTGTVQGTIRNTWDNDFRITGQSINSGQAISFAYDADGLLTQSGSLSITRSSGSGQITGTKLGAITTSQFYNTYGEMTSFAANGTAGALYSESLTRNNKGQITSKTETLAGVAATTSYTYDNMGRLLSVTQGAQTETYTYDLQGNRTIISSGIAGTYDAQDRLLKWNSDGNLQNRGDASFSYDLLGNLKSVVLGSNTYSYAVDGANRRIAKRLNGTLQKGWLYRNGLNPVAELDAQNRVTAQFIYADKAHVPSYMVKTAYANSSDTTGTNTTYRIISDHLGSVRLVVDSTSGAIAQSMSYDTWGKVTADSNPGFQPFGFAGGLYDSDTQMVRFGARDYDPETGRWTSKDPIQFAGGDVNLYGYVLGDPVNLIDPEGKDLVGAIIGGIAGGILGGLGVTDTTDSYTGADVAAGIIGGAVGGAISGFVTSGPLNGAVNVIGDFIQQELTNYSKSRSFKCINIGELAGAFIGGFFGTLPGFNPENAGIARKFINTLGAGGLGLLTANVGRDNFGTSLDDCDCK